MGTTTLVAFFLIFAVAAAAPTVNVEENLLEKRGITCPTPAHVYKGTCVSSCPSPGYFVRASNECFSCGKRAKTCNSNGALTCLSATDIIAGTSCVKTCPRESDLWPEKKKCVPCGSGKYLSFMDGTCVDPADGTGAVYLRFAGHARTALRDPVPDDGAIGSKETSSLSCITQVRYENHYSHGGLPFLSYAFWNSATKNCEGHRGYSVTPANPPFRQRFSGAHEVDFLGLTEPENNACFNTERTPAYKDLVPGYTSCKQIFFAGTTCYVYGTKNLCSTAFS